MKFSLIVPQLKSMSKETLEDFLTGVLGIIAANEMVYYTVENTGIPEARRQVSDSPPKFQKPIEFACTLLEQNSELGIKQVIEYYELISKVQRS